MEAAIAREYRGAGFPFVSVSTPAQELTSGLLQVRVIEFRLAAKTASQASPFDAPYIESRVRAGEGDPIDAGLLSQDLDWLNRFPFRQSEALFTPGQALGDTNLQLQTTSFKPWSAYAGYANSGSPGTGWDRYFVGIQTVVPWLHDAYAAYQATASNDALFKDDRLFSGAAYPAYFSQAGRVTIPTFPRQALDVSIDYVRPTQTVQDFLIRQSVFEAALNYRGALSDLWRPLPGDASVGLEVKRQTSRALFSGVDVQGSSVDIFQVTLGYSARESDRFGQSSGGLTANISPGGMDRRNSDAALASFSTGRSTSAEYGYLSGTFSRLTRLPTVMGIQGLTLTDSLIGQYAAQALPLTEQIGLGSASLVRGYTLDDGAFDTALISRNELRALAFTLSFSQMSPYVFVDAGYGKDRRTKAEAAPVSTGVGLDCQVAKRLTATLDGAWALRSVGSTHSGDVLLETRIALSF